MILSTQSARYVVKALLTFICLLASSQTAWSQAVQGGYAREGGFAGVTFVPGFTFDGVTFDGQTGYKEVDGEEIMLLPKIDKQPLIRAILGYRGRMASIEVSYERTQHDGQFMGVPLGATFQAVNVDGRFFFLTERAIQPHVLVGGAFPWFRVDEGSFLGEEVGDARFRGYGINTEAGVTVFPVRQFGVGVGYSYRVVWFDRATGVSDKLGHLRPRFRETSGNVVVTGTYIF